MIKSLTLLISLLRVILSIMMTRLKSGSSILDANNNSTLTATTSIGNRKESTTGTTAVSPPLLCRGDVISNMIFAKGSSLETYTRSSGALYYPSSFSDNNYNITTESNDSVLKFPSINSCCSSSLSSSCTCSCCLNPQQQPTLGGERLCGILEGGIVGSSSFVGGVPTTRNHHNNYHRSVSPLNDLWWKQGLPPCLVEEEHTLLSTVGKGPWEAYSMTTNDCAGEEPMMMVDTGSQASSRSHVSVPDLRFPSTYICSDAAAVGLGVVRRRRPSPFDSSDEQRDTNNNSSSNGDLNNNSRHMMMMTISPSSSSLIMSHHHPDDVDCCFCCDEPILFRQVESLLCSSWKSPVVPNHQLFMSNLMSSSFNDAIHLRCLAQAIFCVYKYFVQQKQQQQTAAAALPDQQQPFKFKSSMQRTTTLPGWETADWNDFQILDHHSNEDQQQQHIDQPANCPVEEAMKKTLPGPNSSVPKAVLLVMIFIYRIHQTTVAERTTCFNSHSPGNHYAKHSANNPKRLSFRECFSLLVASMCFEKRIQCPVSAFHAPPSTPVSTTSKQGPSTSPSLIQQPCTPKELSKRLPQTLQESRIFPSNTYKSLNHAKPHSDTPPPASHAPPELPPSSRSFTVHQLPQQSARDDATAFDKKCKSSSDAASTNSTRSRTTRRLTNICFKLIPEKIKRVDKHFTNNVTRVAKRQDPGTEGVTSPPQENSASQNNRNAEQDVATVGPSAESALLKGFSTGLSRHNASISTTLKSLPLNFLWQMNSNNPEGSPANNLVKVASGSLLSGWSFGVLGVKRMGRSLIVRDCGLALEILSRFCQNLFVVWSWIDDETHISTGSIGRLIRTAGLILAKARVCASPANSADESSPTCANSVVCDPMSGKNSRSMRGINESSFLTPPYHRKDCETKGGGLLLDHYSPSTHTSGTASHSVQSTSGMNYLDSSRTSSTRATTTSSYAPSMSSPNNIRGNGSRLLFPSSWNNTHNRVQGSNTNNGISTTTSTSDNPSSNNSGLFNRNALKKLQESASGLHLSIPCANNNSLALSQTHDCPLCHTSRQLAMAGTTSTMNTPPSTNSLLLLTQSSDFSTCYLETEIFNMMNRVEYGLGLEADQFTRMSDKVWNSLKTERAH